MEFMSALGSQEDAYRPSLFELDAQQKLRELLQPAVQYLVAIYAQRYPRLLIRLVNNHEEFYALLMLTIERHYLKEWGATFAENFYGLKRVPTSQAGKFTTPVNSQSHGPALSQKDISKSLLVAVGLPYLKCRADLFYHQISGGSSASIFGENERELQEAEELGDPEVHWRRKLAIRFIQLFRKVYPFINALYHGSNLAYNIAYLFGKTRYYTPWLHLLGLELKRMSMNDYRAYYEKANAASVKEGRFSPLQATGRLLGKIIEFLKFMLPMSIFFYKFLEWWYSSEFARGGAALAAAADGDAPNAIPPPEKLMPDPDGIQLPKKPNTCPLCDASPINNPSALPSGYVFCYTCAYRYVEEHGRCPVTFIKVDATKDLTKVYANGNM
ncbi:hypothetical protein VTP01DRAFT_4360 [Rhizomucor pusillus]|uniref:uncharacterized protein n=1 Tax=Rhizomucor pusillus TaxID=4840 RepID=UPI0037448236